MFSHPVSGGGPAGTLFLADDSVAIPTLAGTFSYLGVDGSLCIHFYGGTRPDITTVSRDWQGTSYSGSTKLYPTTSSFSAVSNFLNTNRSNQPTETLTVDWTNNTVVNKTTPIISNAFFNPGTVTWFAVYAGLGYQGKTNGTGWKLAFTGTVGLTGTGSDIEMNRVDIPSSSYPININNITFQFEQNLAQDLIFSKNIYTTALANIFGAGVSDAAGASMGLLGYQFMHTFNLADNANAKYVWNGTNVNRIQLYSGTRPASPDEAVPNDNTLIANIDTFAMHWSNMTQVATSGEVSLSKTGNWIGSALAAQNPNWARILVTNSGTTASIDCSAGLTSSDSIIKYQDPVIAIGQSINLTSIKFAIS